MSTLTDLFGDTIIHTYTREDALNDGALIDLNALPDADGLARDAGFRYPIAITAAAYAETITPPEDQPGQDTIGRAWDVLTMAAIAAKAPGLDPTRKTFTIVRTTPTSGEPQPIELVMTCGPGDSPAPVLTIMLPTED